MSAHFLICRFIPQTSVEDFIAEAVLGLELWMSTTSWVCFFFKLICVYITIFKKNRRYIGLILPIRRTTLSNQLINKNNRFVIFILYYVTNLHCINCNKSRLPLFFFKRRWPLFESEILFDRYFSKTPLALQNISSIIVYGAKSTVTERADVPVMI